MENKLILTFYFSVAGMSRIKAAEYAEQYRHTHGGKIPGATEYFIPLTESDSGSARLDVINTDLATTDHEVKVAINDLITHAANQKEINDSMVNHIEHLDDKINEVVDVLNDIYGEDETEETDAPDMPNILNDKPEITY